MVCGWCSRELKSSDRYGSLPWVLLWTGVARHISVVLAAPQAARARLMGIEVVSLKGGKIGLAIDHREHEIRHSGLLTCLF